MSHRTCKKFQSTESVQPLIVFSSPKCYFRQQQPPQPHQQHCQCIRIAFDRECTNARCVWIWRSEIRGKKKFATHGTVLGTHSKLSRMPFYDEYECVLWERSTSPFAYAYTIIQNNDSAEAPLTHIQLHAIGRKSYLHFFFLLPLCHRGHRRIKNSNRKMMVLIKV